MSTLVRTMIKLFLKALNMSRFVLFHFTLLSTVGAPTMSTLICHCQSTETSHHPELPLDSLHFMFVLFNICLLLNLSMALVAEPSATASQPKLPQFSSSIRNFVIIMSTTSKTSPNSQNICCAVFSSHTRSVCIAVCLVLKGESVFVFSLRCKLQCLQSVTI